jgi:type VI secretion system protein ImpA
MPTPESIPLEDLLAPISDDAPTGEALPLYDSALEPLEDAFKAAKKAERKIREARPSGGRAYDSMGEIVDLATPDWHSVIDGAVDLLRDQSLDFRAAAWLTEALLRVHGFAGLRDGLKLCHGLVTQYWDTLHPLPNEEDGHADAVSAFGNLTSDTSTNVLDDAPISDSATGRTFSNFDRTMAEKFDEMSDEDMRDAWRENGEASLSAYVTGLESTAYEFHVTLSEDIAEAIDLLYELASFFRDNCQRNIHGQDITPVVSSFREHLEFIQTRVKKMVEDKQPSDDAESSSDESGGDIVEAGGVGEARQRKGMTRADAFEALKKIAEFFDKTEPHSPIPYAIRQITRWGHMSLPELLKELIEDDVTMLNLSKRVGFPQPEPEEY